MKKIIKNNTIHLIHLKSGLIYSFGTKELEITEEELEKYQDNISVSDIGTPGRKVISAKVVTPTEYLKDVVEKGVLNSTIINDYMSRGKHTVLNSIDEDKSKMSDSDFDLMLKYEGSHKNRYEIIDKIKKLRGEN